MTHARSDSTPIVSIIEPTWDQRVHLPFLIGLIKVLVEAYPHAKLNFVGGQQQIEFLYQSVDYETIHIINFKVWQPGPDNDTLPLDVFKTVQKFRSLPESVTFESNLIILTSCTSNTLSAVSYLGLASKSCTFLHGNAKDLVGWRSRNPFRKYLDFSSSIRRYFNRGGKAIVLERHIKSRLEEAYPWMATHILYFPHPLVLEEGESISETRDLDSPIHVAFAGLATLAKGFSDYLDFARQLNNLLPNIFTFHSFGALPKESEHLDQAILTSPTKSLSRSDYINSLTRMHYIFSWQHDEYYRFAASGTVYDAINLRIPIIAKRSHQLSEWESAGFSLGYAFEDINDAVSYFSKLDMKSEQVNYRLKLNNLHILRDTFSYKKLGALLSSQLIINN